MRPQTGIGEKTVSTPPAKGFAGLFARPKTGKKYPKQQTTSTTNGTKPKTGISSGLSIEARWSIGFVIFFTMLFLVVIAMKLMMEYKGARDEVLFSRTYAATNYAEQVQGRILQASGEASSLATSLSMAGVSSSSRQARQMLRGLLEKRHFTSAALVSAKGTIFQQAGEANGSFLGQLAALDSNSNTAGGISHDLAGNPQAYIALKIGTSANATKLVAIVSPKWLLGSATSDTMHFLSDSNGKALGSPAISSHGNATSLFRFNPEQAAYYIRTKMVGGVEGKDTNNNETAVGIVTLLDGQLIAFQSGPLQIDNSRWTRTLVFFILMTIAPLIVAAVLVVILLNQMDGLRATRQALADSETRFRLAIEGARSGVFDWDLTLNKVLVTDSLARMFGKEKGATMSSDEFMSMVYPNDQQALRAAIRSAPNSGEIDVEFRAASLPVWLHARGKPLVQSTGEGTSRLIGVAIDITEQKGAQARVAAAESRLRAALESMSESFVVWDARRRLIMSNRKFSEFFGINQNHLKPGVSYEELEMLAAKAIKKIHEGNDDDAVEMELADGRWLHMSERKTGEGGLVGIGTDITALKAQESLLVRNEKKLMDTVDNLETSQVKISELAENFQVEKIRAEEANRSKSEFLANMSHELRTPLNAINGFSEIMQKQMFGPLGDARYLEYVTDILGSGNHLLNLINDILDMSKIESGKMTVRAETVYCDELAEQCVRLVRGRAHESGLEIFNEVHSVPDIQADPRAIKQVLLNILSNAVKFTPTGGKVTLITQADSETGGVLFRVQDTGIGISEEDLPKLCQPFSQIESQHSKSHKGSGLGLALSRTLVELHGGKFEIESEVGAGTLVSVYLPLQPPASASSETQKSEATAA